MAQPASIVIYDMVTGRVPGGHQEDYLAALEDALAEFSPRTFAPFRRPQRHAWPGTPSLAPGDRAGRWWSGFSAFRRLLSAETPTLAIVPNQGPLDFVLLFLAGLARRRGGRGRVIMMMRRDAEGIVGPGLRAHMLDWVVRRLARSDFFLMASDAGVALDHWKARTGRGGYLVSIPVRKPAAHVARGADDPVRVGLIGAFRLEKGAGHYSDMIAAALALEPDMRIECQLPETSPDPRERELIDALAAQWGDEPRVRFHRGHLSSEAFTALLYAVDIVALPYDAVRYGPGTSGVMFEGLAAGRVVAATPIAWGMAEYAEHPGMVWLDGTGRAALSAGLSEAVGRVRARRRSQQSGTIAEDQFRRSWLAVLDNASSAP